MTDQRNASNGEVLATSFWPESPNAMSLGLMVPIAQRNAFPDTPRFTDLVEICQAAKDAGFEIVWFADHFTFFDEERGYRGAWDVFTMMAGVAAVVPDIQIGVLVACTGYRNPGVIAKITEALDDISGGRIILGLGAGWHEPEYVEFGMPFDYRVSRFEDAIKIIQPLLRTGKANHQGRFYQANDAHNLPKGPREQGAPILVGSNSPRMMGLLAQYADAWNTNWQTNAEDTKPLIEDLHAALRKVGRSPESVTMTSGASIAVEGYTGNRPNAIHGDPDSHAKAISAFRELGFRHFICGLDPSTPESVAGFSGTIQKIHASE